MMKIATLAAFAFLSLPFSSTARADCESVAENSRGGKVYMCPLPDQPARVKCWMINGVRLCNGEVFDPEPAKRGADNCSYNRHGKYRCW